MLARDVVPVFGRDGQTPQDLDLRFRELVRPLPHFLFQRLVVPTELPVEEARLQEVLDAQQDLAGLEGFGEEVLGPHLQRLAPRFRIEVSRDDQDREIGVVGDVRSQGGHDIEAVQVRHQQIQHDQIGLEAQKDVDADSLAKLKEKPDNTVKTPKQTGDMPALNEEQAKRIREEASKPGKFSDTLSKIPSLKNTVEGLLHSLEEEQGMNDLDADLEVEEEEEEEEVKPTESLSPEAKAARDAAEKLKDFGRLSGKAVAKLPETADQGTMKTIGKLLIDKQAVEKIIKSGESKELGKGLSNARIISAARGKGISDLLTKIDQYDGVAGSIVVGHDGLVMASTLREGWDKDMMGALSTALLSTSNLTTKKLEIGKLRQMVMLTKDNGHAKTTVLTDVDVGILAVFLEETNVERIDGLLDTIQKTIHG